MASQAQIDANRRNAQHSTGPVSAAGKAASRMNALKSGLYAQSIVIRGEDPAVLDRLIAQYQLDYAPQTAGEQALVDNIVAAKWLLGRQLRIEAQVYECQFSSREYHAGTALGEAWQHGSPVFIQLARRYDSLNRELRNLTRDLERLQAGRRASENQAEAASDPVEPRDPSPAGPEIGFVPSNPSEPPKPAAAARPILIPPPSTVRSGVADVVAPAPAREGGTSKVSPA